MRKGEKDLVFAAADAGPGLQCTEGMYAAPCMQHCSTTMQMMR